MGDFMDIQKLSEKKVVLAIYLIPFVLLVCASLNFLVYLAGAWKISVFVPFVIFHLLFLLSLSAVCGNLMIEVSLELLEDSKNSSLNKLLYGGRRFLPVRNIVFVVAFIAGYVYLTGLLSYISSLQLLMLVIPSLAILFNSRYFVSGRIRFISGTYIFYKNRFCTVISYYMDENGALVFLTDEGTQVATGNTAADSDFKALEAEFQKNGLKCGAKN